MSAGRNKAASAPCERRQSDSGPDGSQPAVIAASLQNKRNTNVPGLPLRARFIARYSIAGYTIAGFAVLWFGLILSSGLAGVMAQENPAGPDSGAAQAESGGAATGGDGKTAEAAGKKEPTEPEVPADGVLPVARAWEYSHYRVRIWICSDGSANGNNLAAQLPDALARLGQLCDPSGWELLPVMAPDSWRWRAIAHVREPAEALAEIGNSQGLGFDDKLMLVVLKQESQGLTCQVRELDRTTNQWGAMVERVVEQPQFGSEMVFEMVRTAFMPIARIDRVTEDNDVYMRSRGANLCQYARYSAELQGWAVELNRGSPVWVRNDDCFIPVLRKTDRDNKLVSQDPVEFTFIKVNPDGPPQEKPAPANPAAPAPAAGEADGKEAAAKPAADQPAGDQAAGDQPAEGAPAADKAASEGAATDPAVAAGNQAVPAATGDVPANEAAEATEAREALLGKDYATVYGRVHSSFRAPLVQRKTKRLEKLALVIRPPKSNTMLKFVAADQTRQPMEGLEIYSRPLDAEDDKRSEFLGKTDWRGMVLVPPSEAGLRMIYVKRGARGLMKVPVMPGFYALLESTVANDEARLFAEGVIAGMGNEILDVVAQRQIFEKMIDDLLKLNTEEGRTRAISELDKYRELPKPQQMRARLSDEKSRLQTQAKDKREEQFITTMFDDLEKVLSRFLGQSRETELLQRIQGGTTAAPADAASGAGVTAPGAGATQPAASGDVPDPFGEDEGAGEKPAGDAATPPANESDSEAEDKPAEDKPADSNAPGGRERAIRPDRGSR